MPNPTTAAEWAKAIDEGLDFDTKPQTFIQECLESYARQRVAEALAHCGKENCFGWKVTGHTNWVTEEAAQERVEAFRERAARLVDRSGRPDRLVSDIAAALRALEP